MGGKISMATCTSFARRALTISPVVLQGTITASITARRSAIFFELRLMPFIVSTTQPITSPPLAAALEAPSATWLACRALSVLLLTLSCGSTFDR